MKTNFNCLVVALLGTTIAWGQDRDGPQGRSAIQDGVEVLTRGPVHEAFAGTITFNPEPGVVVRRSAPEPIEELPPEQKPTGDNVAWIPGYWAWDDERDDFLWVSGIWRSLPPGRQWISGYWATSARNSQWTSGYWADAQATEVNYLPEPPQTVEAGPNVEAPSADHTWLPGVWVWQQNRYAWRPGYWANAQPNWVWNPPHYIWAPRGYVFVDGYYDYPVAQRGVLFAPVFFNSGIRAQRGFSFLPRTVINPAVFASHLFLRPNYGHYYFGDYYGNNYATNGFSPWFSFANSGVGYDPFFAQQHWINRNDLQWNQQLQTDFAYRQANDDARPARTWSDQIARISSGGATDDQSFVVAASIDDLAQSEDTAIRFNPVAQEEREQLGQRRQQIREARAARRNLEAEVASPAADASAGDVVSQNRVELPRSPVVSQPTESLNGDNAPPQAADTPETDAAVQPQPRTPRGRPSGDGTPIAGSVPGATPSATPPATPSVTPPATPSVTPPATPSVTPPARPSVTPPATPSVTPPATPSVTPPATPSVTPPARPSVTPRGDRPSNSSGPAPGATPQVNPLGESPRNAPGQAPQVNPRGESPRNAPGQAPQVNPRSESPRNAPGQAPRVNPRSESPRNAPGQAPQVNPRSEQPRVQQPRVERPRVERPRLGRPSAPRIQPQPATPLGNL